jgi:MarR family protein
VASAYTVGMIVGGPVLTCTTFVLHRLEQQGLIERRPHPKDRRAKRIAPTPGRDTRATVLDRLNAHPRSTAVSRRRCATCCARSWSSSPPADAPWYSENRTES